MNKEQPILTIAVPTYNGSKTIKSMLNVLLPQITEKVEILVSDNCSTDDTLQIIYEYKEKYPFIRIIENSENIGADGNFLQCMREATGKFTMLISDDDIIVEGAIKKILLFLEKYPTISLAYLYTIGFKDCYEDICHCHEYKDHLMKPMKDICTSDKMEFFQYVGRQWGFTSSFLWSTKRFQEISDPEQYFGTFWLQSYIHILCSDRPDDKLGIIAGPCIAAGEYGIIGNYDVTKIEAIYYRKMLDFAIKKAGYDKDQLISYWVWKVSFLASKSIVKERAIGIEKTSVKQLFDIMKPYPYAWFHLFPYFFVPKSMCRTLLKIIRKIQGRDFISYVNRSTD